MPARQKACFCWFKTLSLSLPAFSQNKDEQQCLLFGADRGTGGGAAWCRAWGHWPSYRLGRARLQRNTLCTWSKEAPSERRLRSDRAPESPVNAVRNPGHVTVLAWPGRGCQRPLQEPEPPEPGCQGRQPCRPSRTGREADGAVPVRGAHLPCTGSLRLWVRVPPRLSHSVSAFIKPLSTVNSMSCKQRDKLSPACAQNNPGGDRSQIPLTFWFWVGGYFTVIHVDGCMASPTKWTGV